MKKLALISSYCNSLEKQQVLVNNLVKFEKLGIDTLLFAPKGLLPKWIINKANHCIITEENPILSLEERKHLIWKKPVSKFNLRHTLISRDYGWASLNQIKRLLAYGCELDYDIIYSIVYDLNIDDELTKVINNNDVNYFFSNRRNDGTIMSCGNIFITLDRNNCREISKRITLERYNSSNESAENLLNNIRKELNIPMHQHITNDLLYELSWDKLIQFNISNIDDVKIFIDNSQIHIDKKEIAIHFYDLKNPIQVKVKDLDMTIDEEKILFIKLDKPDFIFTVNGESINVDGLTTFPITEIKIDDNNNWEFLKKYGTK